MWQVDRSVLGVWMFAWAVRFVGSVVDGVSITRVLVQLVVVVLNWRFLPGVAILLYQRYLGRVLSLVEWRMYSFAMGWVVCQSQMVMLDCFVSLDLRSNVRVAHRVMPSG